MKMRVKAAIKRDAYLWILAIALAAVLLLIQMIQFQYWSRSWSQELQLALLASLFLALGIGLGWGLWVNRTQLATPSPPPVPEGLLSKREEDVLQALALGLSNRAMAETLHISVNTVKTHLSKIYSKLEVANRKEALALLAQWNRQAPGGKVEA